MNWLKRVVTRQSRYDELSATIHEHLEEKIADLIDDGMTQEQAERTARREFGNVTRIEERSREVWQWSRLESIWGRYEICLATASPIARIFGHGNWDLGSWNWSGGRNVHGRGSCAS
jgi:hypothetical protein